MIIIIILLLFFAALVYHVPQFLEKCGCISKVNCQPVEKQCRSWKKGNRKLFARVYNLYRNKRSYIKKLDDDRGSIAT